MPGLARKVKWYYKSTIVGFIIYKKLNKFCRNVCVIFQVYTRVNAQLRNMFTHQIFLRSLFTDLQGFKYNIFFFNNSKDFCVFRSLGCRLEVTDFFQLNLICLTCIHVHVQIKRIPINSRLKGTVSVILSSS